MSDEEKPKVDLAALRERNERLRREADEAWAVKARAESVELMADIAAMAERQLAAFRVLPCGGEVARVGECADDFAGACERRDTPSCPRRIIAEDARRAGEAERERLKLSGVPGDVRRVLEDEFKPTPATQRVDAWLASRKRLLLLAGSFGTGKSIAAGYAIKRAPGRWMHASEIKKAARFEHEARMRELERTPLLVVDDIGSEFNDASGWGKATLTELLLVRWDEGLRTILTCNLDGAAWKKYADPRIVDRLAGKDGDVFGTAGPSMRRA